MNDNQERLIAELKKMASDGRTELVAVDIPRGLGKKRMMLELVESCVFKSKGEQK